MAISRSQLAKELEPGLNALFGLEYNRYENEQIVEGEAIETSGCSSGRVKPHAEGWSTWVSRAGYYA